MALRLKAIDTVRNILMERAFTPAQIDKVIPRLDPEHAKEPNLLADTIDCWNQMMTSAKLEVLNHDSISIKMIPKVAAPPKSSPLGGKVNMNTILADVEPGLLGLGPKKLIQRHENIKGLGIANSVSELWLILFNAPRGFYLQEWADLSKKIMYCDHKLLDLLYIKKELQEASISPLLRCCALVERSFDHIRTRYLFASRVGYKELGQFYDVTTAKTKPTLRDLVLSDDRTFLKKFAPFCSLRDYHSFAKLILERAEDCDDADIIKEMAEIECLRYDAWPRKLRKSEIRQARLKADDLE